MPVAIDPIAHELERSAGEKPELAHVYAVLLPRIANADLRITPVEMPAKEAREKLNRGQPLLQGLKLGFDDSAAANLLIDLARAIENIDQQTEGLERSTWIRAERRRVPRSQALTLQTTDESVRATQARQIRLLVQNGDLNVAAILASVAEGDLSSVIALADDLSFDSGLLWTLAQFALRPAMNAWRQQLSSLAQDSAWSHSFCYVCGAEATFGELQGNAAALHLRCARCGGDWRMPRPACVYCGNDDPKKLVLFYPDGERERAHVQACDKCLSYLKVMSSFEPTPFEMLVVRDLETLELDRVAKERGFTRSGPMREAVVDF